MDSDSIVGCLVRNSDFPVLPDQRDAWLEQIRLLQGQLGGLMGLLFMEFSIPRMGRRIDAVLLTNALCLSSSSKWDTRFLSEQQIDQVWDYALDLKNFHEASHSASNVPILMATGANASPPIELHAGEDKVYKPIRIHATNFRATVDLVLQTVKGEPLEEQLWSRA